MKLVLLNILLGAQVAFSGEAGLRRFDLGSDTLPATPDRRRTVPIFTLVGGCDHLKTSNGGRCVETKRYGNNHACEIEVRGTQYLNVLKWGVEYHHSCGWDSLEINGKKYCGGSSQSPEGVRASGRMKWNTDYSVTGEGWKLCAGEQSISVSGGLSFGGASMGGSFGGASMGGTWWAMG